MCGGKYLRATIILCLIGSFEQQTGVNMLNIYSNRIITESNKQVHDEKKILANRAT